MSTSGPRSRRSRPPSKNQVVTRPADALPLARVVPTLASETLHALIRHRGLDAAGELLAAATPEQLTAVVDIDLWRRAPSGRDEQLDAERFGEWLEALADCGELLALQTIAALDADLVIAGLSRYIRVLDPGTLLPTVCSEEAIDHEPPVFCGWSREVGGYLVRARTGAAWDAIVSLLFALQDHRPDLFHALMRGCRRLSNSTPEIDGLDDLLLAPEQLLHDVAIDREGRRAHQGYVSPADARAFLQLARSRRQPATVNPVAAAHLREANADVPTDALATLVDEAELLIAVRTRELAFLANVLMSGSSIASRAFTPREASDGALAICNLGLEHWPTSLAVHETNLVAAFEAGWVELHDLVMSVARHLIEALGDLQCADDELQAGLSALRGQLLRECENGTPWRAAGSLEVLSMLDMPVCLALQSLIAECPVLPDALTAILERRRGPISPIAFEFISTAARAARVRDFAATLLDALTR